MPLTHPRVGMSPGHQPCCPLQSLWGWFVLYPAACCHWLMQHGTASDSLGCDTAALADTSQGLIPTPAPGCGSWWVENPGTLCILLAAFYPTISHWGTLPAGTLGCPCPREQSASWVQCVSCCSQTPHPGCAVLEPGKVLTKNPWCQLCSWLPALPHCGVTPKDTELITTPPVLLLQTCPVPLCWPHTHPARRTSAPWHR